VGALGHYLESEGLATVGISMVREHTEALHPPRALWVPFELGRPLGVPDDPEFQRDVLRAALSLLERPEGPVLEDYPRDAPRTPVSPEGWACPVLLPGVEDSEQDELTEQLLDEVARLRSWFEEARRRRGRTTFGVSGLEPEAIDEALRTLGRFAAGEAVEPPAAARHEMPGLLRFLANDAKTYYQEAVTAFPGTAPPPPDEMARWLYTETVLGRVLFRVRERLANSDDPAEQRFQGGIVPGAFFDLRPR
jgi:hypothetical protein